MAKRPFLLIVRDGWGWNDDPKLAKGNATKLADTPVDDALRAEYPWTLIHTFGEWVGLPEGTMGNSEVGHQNIGAGRIVFQQSVRITRAIRDESFFESEALVQAAQHVKTNGGKLHLMGLASDIGVHSLLGHLYACVEMAKRRGLDRVFVHAFGDGRDSPPDSGLGYIKDIEAKLAEIGVGAIGSVCGRFYAMDRDDAYDRNQLAYRMLVFGEGWRASSATEAVQHYYDNPTAPNMKGDEFIYPTVICPDGQETPPGLIADGDSVVFFNFRADRARQITRAFVMDTFPFQGKTKAGVDCVLGFDRGRKLHDLCYITITDYKDGQPVLVAFPDPPELVHIIGEYASEIGLKQFRCAETQKYNHVTYFFNCRRSDPYPNEDWVLVESPKVKTFDMKPEMSAYEVTEAVLPYIKAAKHDLMVVNYANPDMVGHTGVLEAAVKAAAVVDECVGRLLDALHEVGGIGIVTADHGNFEVMIDPVTGHPHTAHTVGDVPLILVDDRYKGRKLREGGCLADVIPTALEMMRIDQPEEMTGKSLLQM
ncbi:MAG: 2,3-bisphosphoglycerate-independent phosphoglycerate mutase [Phycisphaerae bacterium]|nr:2,3-bisphosphoglycerate-independent phosphoglycerate mutase [Phycisphaerae bacterium]